MTISYDDPPPDSQEVNIRMPNVSINIRPDNNTREWRKYTSTPKSRTFHSGMGNRDINQWIDGLSPILENPATVTQSGRVSKPPNRFGTTIDDLRRKESQDLRQAMEQSLLDSKRVVRKGGSLRPTGQAREHNEPRPGPSGAQAVPSSKGGSKATSSVRGGSLKSGGRVEERHEP